MYKNEQVGVALLDGHKRCVSGVGVLMCCSDYKSLLLISARRDI